MMKCFGYLWWLLHLVASACVCTAFNSVSSGVALTTLDQCGPFCRQQNPSQCSSSLSMKPLSREDEIRRKIVQLKKDGRVKNSSSSSSSATPLSSYQQKINQKLGKKKSKLLGIGTAEDEEIDAIQAELDSTDEGNYDEPQGRLGAVPEIQEENAAIAASSSLQPDTMMDTSTPSSSSSEKPLIDPTLFKDDSYGPEMSEEDLVDLVAEKLARKRKLEAQVKTEAAKEKSSNSPFNTASDSTSSSNSATAANQKTTTGVGGAWNKDDNSTASTEYYQPKSGSWGAFPRPKDISKAYGGGRRVGAGYSKEDQADAELATQEALKRYREKVGIDVPSEKEHAAEIDEALEIGQLAMQRGVYATAVSALEKVTPWCSTNSKVGSKVFLELAMAYEAVGRNEEAYQVYQTLSTCRMEDVKYNAKRLLYGMEAMEFMRDVSSEFSRKKIRNTFIDTTGLGNIAQNFDDVYQTAYIDLESGFYKRLTESVVRSNREARQILLKATGKGEIGRMRVVQALRSIARHFDDALELEQAAAKKANPTAIMNGKPILVSEQETKQNSLSSGRNLDEFVLSSPEQMMSNLQGEWRLQLLADRKGDGVSYFNTTQAIQRFSTDGMIFTASGPSGFLTLDQSGDIEMDASTRILSRKNIKSAGTSGGFFGIFGDKQSGFAGAVSGEQQIMSVDSILLITKCPPQKGRSSNDGKEHFAVWRRESERLP